jgi:hypothetical protein
MIPALPCRHINRNASATARALTLIIPATSVYPVYLTCHVYSARHGLRLLVAQLLDAIRPCVRTLVHGNLHVGRFSISAVTRNIPPKLEQYTRLERMSSILERKRENAVIRPQQPTPSRTDVACQDVACRIESDRREGFPQAVDYRGPRRGSRTRPAPPRMPSATTKPREGGDEPRRPPRMGHATTPPGACGGLPPTPRVNNVLAINA